jgi:hypothetical protein
MTKLNKVQQAPAPRRMKWEYIIPIVATPAAHICVSLVRKYPQHQKKLFYGVLATTWLTIASRMILMYDAGYPGAESADHEKLSKLPAVVRLFVF